jgi:hypothetical protein
VQHGLVAPLVQRPEDDVVVLRGAVVTPGLGVEDEDPVFFYFLLFQREGGRAGERRGEEQEREGGKRGRERKEGKERERRREER